MVTHWSLVSDGRPKDRLGPGAVSRPPPRIPRLPWDTSRLPDRRSTPRAFHRCAAAAAGVDHEGRRFESGAGPRCEFLQRAASFAALQFPRHEQDLVGFGPGVRSRNEALSFGSSGAAARAGTSYGRLRSRASTRTRCDISCPNLRAPVRTSPVPERNSKHLLSAAPSGRLSDSARITVP
jgi:hypothetical protein